MNSNFACFLVSKLTLLIAGVAMCSAQEAQPDNEIVEKPETLQQQMLGAWVLAGKPDAEIEPKPGARMKFIGLGYWLITQHNPKNGQVIFHHGGTYSLDGDRYVETIAFANKSTKQLIGVKSVFKIKIENEKLINIGQDNPFTELWVRAVVKKTDAFEAAIETIASSNDIDMVRKADTKLRSSGRAAIDSLRKHLADNRVPASNYLSRTVDGIPNMSDHCFWLIQDIIEPPVPKLYASLYSVLTTENVGRWLDDRAEKSIIELQRDAAQTSLNHAKSDFETKDASYAKQAIEIYSKRLAGLQENE